MVATIDLSAAGVDDVKAHLAELAGELTVENTDETVAEFSRVLADERFAAAVLVIDDLMRAAAVLIKKHRDADEPLSGYQRSFFQLLAQSANFYDAYGAPDIRESFPLRAFTLNRIIAASEDDGVFEDIEGWKFHGVIAPEAPEGEHYRLTAVRKSDGAVFLAIWKPSEKSTEFSRAVNEKG